jgi:hypothetical protein
MNGLGSLVSNNWIQSLHSHVCICFNYTAFCWFCLFYTIRYGRYIGHRFSCSLAGQQARTAHHMGHFFFVLNVLLSWSSHMLLNTSQWHVQNISTACCIHMHSMVISTQQHVQKEKCPTWCSVWACCPKVSNSIFSSDFGNAFSVRTLCLIFMHWVITFPSFPAHEHGRYEKKSKLSPEYNVPLPGRVGCGNDTNHVCVNAYVTQSVHCLFFFASLASPLPSEFLLYESLGSGQCSGRGGASLTPFGMNCSHVVV